MPRCGNCHKNHETVQDVKDCYVGRLPGQKDAGPAFDKEPATEAQIDFLLRLSKDKNTEELSKDNKRMVAAVAEMYGKSVTAACHLYSKADVSQLLSAMTLLPYSTKEKWPGVPEGKYAIANDDGVIAFWEVSKPTEGRYAGRCFANQIVGSPRDWRRLRSPGVTVAHAMAIIEADPVAAATLFGIKTKSCGRCGSPLSNIRSRAAGFGETCAERVGWGYPSRDEARRILKERGEDPDAVEKQLELEGVPW